MNTSSLHKSGALLLEPINEIMLELGRDTNILLTTNDGGVAMEGGVGPDSMEGVYMWIYINYIHV